MSGRLIKKNNISFKNSSKKIFLSSSLFVGVIDELQEVESSADAKLGVSTNSAHGIVATKVSSKNPKTFSISEVKKKLGENASVLEMRKELVDKLQKEITKSKTQLKFLTEEIGNLRAEHNQLMQQKEVLSEEVLKKASKDAEKYISKAKNKGDALLETAKSEAEQIVADAKKNAEIIKKESEDGRDKFIKETTASITSEIAEQVWETGKEELVRLKKLLEHITKETIAKRNEIIESSHKHLIDIALTISKKVIKKNREEDEQLVVRTINSALKKVGSVVRLTVRINPEDWDVSNKYYDVFKQLIGEIDELELIKDPTLKRGDCVIESDLGVIDARLESQLAEIENAIEEVETLKSR